jgi:putative component of membrane protein insertase Oxa1/YidC/SpoIIIJ protein YidD
LKLLRNRIADNTFDVAKPDIKSSNPIDDITSKSSKKINRTSFLNLDKQYLRNCKFQTNCSSFCKQSLTKFGLIKGLFVSTDRLLRCDRITHATSSPYRINIQGKMIDFIEEYQN